MKQLFKAVDSLDGDLSWFFFDGEGGETIVDIESGCFDSMVEYVKINGADWPGGKDSRERMINPVLVAEWE